MGSGWLIFPTGIQLDNTAKPNWSTSIKMLSKLNIWFKFCLMAFVVVFCSRGISFFFFFRV